ncbi:unnamed protein product [Nesidiocoris tenuis]|uniref:Uncharacterized protein n=1 Tax=Nesidiocoris tenuis TaxID=355587 RepID=A0A6H5HIJ2_9HEMI|nr:unnamed protein product [Nesidiocoris tenuis]
MPPNLALRMRETPASTGTNANISFTSHRIALDHQLRYQDFSYRYERSTILSTGRRSLENRVIGVRGEPTISIKCLKLINFMNGHKAGGILLKAHVNQPWEYKKSASAMRSRACPAALQERIGTSRGMSFSPQSTRLLPALKTDTGSNASILWFESLNLLSSSSGLLKDC